MLTTLGFKRKRYEDFIVEMETQARELFGSDINLNDNSPLGKFIKLQAFARAEENELTESVYYSAFIDFAEGITLDYAVKYKGLTRIQAEKSVGEVTFTVTPGTTVNSGVIVATTGEIEFVTTETVADSDNDGQVIVKIEAVEPGVSGNVPSNTITIINTPSIGLTSVTNAIATENGRDTETDAELRSRYEQTTGGSSSTDGIRTTILNEVDGVRGVVVIENTSDVSDGSGRPPHSFEAVVLGGLSDDIAAAVLRKKPAGIQSYGSQTKVLKDSSGNDQTIKFSYATTKNIYLNVNVTKNASFPTNGADMVKLELIKYIGGTDADFNEYSGLSMGDDVIITKLISRVYAIDGVDDVSITISTDNVTFNSSNVAVAITEIAETSWDKLVITVV